MDSKPTVTQLKTTLESILRNLGIDSIAARKSSDTGLEYEFLFGEIASTISIHNQDTGCFLALEFKVILAPPSFTNEILTNCCLDLSKVRVPLRAFITNQGGSESLLVLQFFADTNSFREEYLDTVMIYALDLALEYRYEFSNLIEAKLAA